MKQVNVKWHSPPKKPVLADGDIHLWRVALNQFPKSIEKSLKFLSSDEQLVSKQYSLSQQKKYIVKHQALRSILGKYIDDSPQQLRFKYGVNGKPHLLGNVKAERLMFNMSHSHKLGIIAVTEEKSIGVDIEHIQSDLSLVSLVSQFYTETEIGVINSLPLERQSLVTLAMWTRKEALLKARGEDISSLIRASKSKNTKRVRKYAKKYLRHTFDMDREYVATVVSENVSPNFFYWEWRD